MESRKPSLGTEPQSRRTCLERTLPAFGNLSLPGEIMGISTQHQSLSNCPGRAFPICHFISDLPFPSHTAWCAWCAWCPEATRLSLLPFVVSSCHVLRWKCLYHVVHDSHKWVKTISLCLRDFVDINFTMS